MESLIVESVKPVLSLSFINGQLKIAWLKEYGTDAILIEVNRGDGTGFQFLTIDRTSDYTDLASITQRGWWKYRAIFLCDGECTGEWSEVISTTI